MTNTTTHPDTPDSSTTSGETTTPHIHAKIAGDLLMKARQIVGSNWCGALDDALVHIDIVTKALTPAPQASTTEQAGELLHQMRHRVGGVWTDCDADGETCIKRMPHWADAYEFRTLQVVSPATAAATTASASDPCGACCGDKWLGGSPCFMCNGTGRAQAPSREAAVPQIKTWQERAPSAAGFANTLDRFDAMTAEIADLRAALAGREAAPLDERALFEYAGRATKNLARNDSGDYVSPSVQCAWEAWQARAALAQPAAPVVDGERKYTQTEAERLALHVRDAALERVAAAAARSAPVMPEGWKPMPAELTQAMIVADPYGLGYGRLHAIYRALFNAAPSHPEPAGGKEQAA